MLNELLSRLKYNLLLGGFWVNSKGIFSRYADSQMVRRCPQCKAPRKGEKCWKCGTATFEPCEGWDEPKLPPINRIRELAHEVGYAIGEHGSKERDLDIIAAPWTESAVEAIDLLLHLKSGLKGRLLGGIEHKPFGRVGANIQLDGFFKVIDISVCPKL